MSVPFFPRFASFLTVIAALGCGSPNLFDAPSAAIEVEFREDMPIVIDYEVTGGFVGIWRHLTVFSTQLVRFTDDPRAPQRSYRDRLDDAAYQNLITTFVTANFFGLNDRYLEPRVVDGFRHLITFNHQGQTKTIEAHDGALPQQLRDIITALNGTIDSLMRDGIRLELTLSDSVIAPGEEVTFTLTATAPQEAGRTLLFPDGQTYDFFVVSDPLPPADPIPKEKIVWKWSADKVFIQILRQIELKAGDSLTYSEPWVARDAEGVPLRGRFWVIGSLVSVPGGNSRAVELRVE